MMNLLSQWLERVSDPTDLQYEAGNRQANLLVIFDWAFCIQHEARVCRASRK